MDLLLLEKTLLGSFVAILVAILVSKLRGKRFKLPPGPLPVPVFGNWLQVGDDLNHRNLTDLAKKFGDIFLLRMGQRNLVVVSSPDLSKEVLHTQGVEFGSRTRNVVFDIFTGKGQDMVFTVYGEHWRKMRRIMTVPFFTNKVVQQYRYGWEDEAARVVEDVKKNPEAATNGIVLRRRLQLMMYNNMYRIMFDRRFESEEDPLFNKLKALNGERSRLAQSFEYNYGDFIPILRPFLRGYLKICKEVKDKRLQLFKDYFVDERKKLASTKNTNNEGLKCAIDHMLDAQKKGEINEDNVLYIVENINVAAIETTLWSIEWGIAELVNHPEIQKKLRHELDTVLGPGHQITEPDTYKLPYLNAVIKETLRLRMAIPLLVPHMNLHDAKLGGFDIPAESKILVNAWWLANNPAHWKNPEEFRPERFLEEEAKVEANGNDFRYLPFGVGRRSCPGIILALPILGITLGRLVQNFELLPPPGQSKIDTTGKGGQFSLHILKHSTIVAKPRQKQYFEQRRRKQHQQAAGLDSFEEGDNIRGENCRENHRSLDVLSLQNWSTIAKDFTPTFHLGSSSEFRGREDPKVNASTVNSLIFKDPPLIRANPVGPLLSPEIKDTRTLSGYQPETVSPKKVLFISSNNRSKGFSGTNNKLDPCKMTIQQSSSVFDLLADDEPNEKSDGSPEREAHVAFSVEGLGKVGSETPSSPRQPGRYVSYGYPSPLKASRQISSSKNLDYVLNDLEVEVIEDSYCKLKNNLSSITDSVHLDGHGRMRNSFGEKKTFGETENRDDKWGATCRSRDASFLDKRESDISWNSWPYSMNGSSAEFLKYGNDRLPDYAFEGCHLLKKRDSMNAKEAFNILDSPYLKHQTSETDFDFMISERAARKPSLRMNFGFGDPTTQPDWSCFITEDARDNQSLLSEESSSSTAVRDKVTDISLSNSRARCSRRHQNASGFPENNCSAKSIFLKGRQFKNGEEIQKGNNEFGSGKSTQIPMLSDSRSAHNLDCPFQEKIGSSRGWMFKEGYGSADMNMCFSSPCQTSEKKHPLSGSKPWTEETFDAFVPEPQIDARLPFDTTKHGGSIKRSPSGSLVCEKFTLCQKSSSRHTHDSPTFSKVEFGATKPDFTLDSPDFEFEGNLSDPLEDASHGEKLVLELSAKESVRKGKKNRSKFQQTDYEKVETWNSPVGNNMKLMDALESVDNDPDRKDARDEPLETSSSVKIPNKSESSVDKKEYLHDAEVYPPWPKGNKEAENEGSGVRKISRDCNHPDSSPPVMMLKSYVLQLLCVQKAPKEASVQTA
ncbi:hypothetical protein SADUNF_Sadunf13G0123300 [Salix dunnii]|uniref:Trans-cinnamate 4-monooxygenase n=1 Tax=Salix dunnii TaxID=1413687 RepID=A0A835JM51_9ROSI|nr:hypothetical protein SADUNF_Sadunf13G0123300 [Salix dunnii]